MEIFHGLHCPDCDIHYREPSQSTFSFNSPVGACDTCRGFGRVIGVDYGLVIPDESKTLGGGAVKPWQTQSFKECQDDLVKYAKKRGIPLDKPWRNLSAAQKSWVIDGEPEWVNWKKSWPGIWYGVKHYFDWLESKAYKMHIRVLLSRYRAYTPCTVCEGSRLKPDALLWRVGNKQDADAVLEPGMRYRPKDVAWSDAQLQSVPGLTIHDLMQLPVDRCARFFADVHMPSLLLDEATALLLGETRTRLSYLQEVGLGYLTLDRQSRTLSGGEVQRINLTTALGTSLTNTLFVLDEPSIGLHPRDMGRVIAVMRKLRDAGNSLVVVEHDPQIMFAADRILDMGPGPGEKGGEIVFFGQPAALAASANSLTGEYLRGRRRADAGLKHIPVKPEDPRLEVLGAAAHNLDDIDVAIPLNRLVCVTGVSGSGKSTLVQDVLYPALLKHKGKPTESAGTHKALTGADSIGDVVMVDQTPIGRTTRSNPASYVGAFDAIRDLFAKSPMAKERAYKPGMFSFNSGDGRCPTCGGNGFEHVEMQFLSDVYLRCPDCDGRRYRPELLEVTIAPDGKQPKSIADVLDLTVSEAVDYFANSPEVLRRLKPLAEVGLEYLRLGQPVPTLSGGEAQRLKLAGHLAQAVESSIPRPSPLMGSARYPAKSGAPRPSSLFLFDEPTTGLHFEDIAKLLRSFRRLVEAGNSVLVIEHNLDVIAACDWIIDLGPEGGEAGGEVVFMGTPEQIRKDTRSHTGVALKEYEQAIEKGAFAQQALGAGRISRPSSLAALCEPTPSSIQDSQRPRAQPEEHQSLAAAGKIHRHYRGVRQRQVHAGIRHRLRRRPAPLSRVAERLCEAIRAGCFAPGRGCHLRYTADGGDRAAHQPWRSQEHRGHADRDPSFPAPVVREARHPALSRLHGADRAAEPGSDCCAHHARLQGPAYRPHGAAGGESQRCLHRSRQMGQQQGIRIFACRW